MSAIDHSPLPDDSQPVNYRQLGLVSLGHLTNDMYGSALTSLTPYLVIRGTISKSTAGLVLLVYLIGSSILQPVFGAISDRHGSRLFAVLGPLWIGVAASLAGWAGNAATMLALAAGGGVGTAAFHPQAAAIVNRLSPHSKGWVMSIFSTGGNVGFATGPLVAAAISIVGFHYSPLAIVPGLLVTVLLARNVPRLPRTQVHPDSMSVRSIPARTWRSLTLIVSIIAIRSGIQYALIIFLPLYYVSRGEAPEIGSYLAFVFSLFGAMGGLMGGRLSDRYGRRQVVTLSLLGSMPLLYLALFISGPATWPLMVLAGATLLASNSVTVVQGQELLPANTALASGLTMGFGFGLSGVIGFGLAVLADHLGVETVIFVVPAFAPVAALVGWFVRDPVPAGSHKIRPLPVSGPISQ